MDVYPPSNSENSPSLFSCYSSMSCDSVYFFCRVRHWRQTQDERDGDTARSAYFSGGRKLRLHYCVRRSIDNDWNKYRKLTFQFAKHEKTFSQKICARTTHKIAAAPRETESKLLSSFLTCLRLLLCGAHSIFKLNSTKHSMRTNLRFSSHQMSIWAPL